MFNNSKTFPVLTFTQSFMALCYRFLNNLEIPQHNTIFEFIKQIPQENCFLNENNGVWFILLCH